MRLAKKIALSGIASRRQAEKWILEGKVSVNGERILSPVTFVGGEDEVLVLGKKIPEQPQVRVWKYYKPRGVITTRFDPKGRKTVFDDILGHINYDQVPICVGRLDFNSEGLLLLTTSGELARKLELPSSKISRTYNVRCFGHLKDDEILLLKKGVLIDGVNYGKFLIDQSDKNLGKNTWMQITIFEGKNREIRKVLEYFGCIVNKLVRIKFGKIVLGDLRPSEIEEIDLSKIKNLI